MHKGSVFIHRGETLVKVKQQQQKQKHQKNYDFMCWSVVNGREEMNHGSGRWVGGDDCICPCGAVGRTLVVERSFGEASENVNQSEK